MWSNIILLGLATLQRLAEFVIAKRNTKKLLAKGGFAVGPPAHIAMIVLHVIWLAGLWYLAWNLTFDWNWIFAYIALEAARGWIVAALGSQWTTRIIVVPGEKFEDEKPFNTFREPNYIIIAAELFILPMAYGLWWYGAAFAAVYVALVYWRWTGENKGLASLREPPHMTSPNVDLPPEA
ncbi:MAG TPA: isoprenylcysteine carboxylmethyltransferase family protein [Aestuariivirga sp.]|nr:hypothetical protein [Alphaproteobacteria bacterium]HRX34963.1 isoprenylcysteine carboxylmethyltransferase family protein [Aestuariivirga sp.]